MKKRHLHTQFIKFLNEKYKNYDDEIEKEEIEKEEIEKEEIEKEDEVKEDNEKDDEVKLSEYDDINVDELVKEYNNMKKKYKNLYGSIYKRK